MYLRYIWTNPINIIYRKSNEIEDRGIYSDLGTNKCGQVPSVLFIHNNLLIAELMPETGSTEYTKNESSSDQ